MSETVSVAERILETLRIVDAQALFYRVAKSGEQSDEDWSDVFEKNSIQGDLVAKH